MSRLNRRSFIKQTLAAAATITVAGTKSSGQVVGANDTIRIGVAGLNGRGSAHVGAFAPMQGVQITYLIDPDTRTFAARARTVQERGGNSPQTVQDVRRALEDRNLDAISIATPNHWHSLMTVWAAQAGKHVYVEKPLSHNVKEGKIAAQMARRHNVIVQHGTQSRSSQSWANIVEIIRSGQLGRLQVARALCYKRRDNSQGRVPSVNRVAAPKQLDFNLWQGPASERPYHENLVHYRWHWLWDFGNGDIGNQGVHQMDIARWGIPNATLPRSVFSVGGRFDSDRGETPNTQISIMDFGQTQLIFEVRGMESPAFHGQGVGNIFHLEEGMIAGNRFYPRGRTEPAPLPRLDNPARRGSGNGEHFANFIAAVRTRRHQDLNADVLDGHYSSALCHLANISYRLGQEAPFAPRPRSITDNPEAGDAFARMEEHLRNNGVQLDSARLRVGQFLEFDAQTERFTRNDDANRMLTRAYREPFVVPDSVS
ncbi:MAG: Gfo/Idh/MocA family oxidoreductase [Gemmataceae bacterium]|nr:Gfo/Idh/MocA family oxidoreductase [Gemmataceae bacterium]MCI0742261.1 Gfo/Idh/MocA family oxidoreductase [Gemmataceae bacterium]